MRRQTDDQIRQKVRDTYAGIARAGEAGCGCCDASSCGTVQGRSTGEIAAGIGYSREDVAKAPEGSNMGLGCGNPQEIASLQAGETVLDLGSGGGFDCFLAAEAVGDTGRVIGVDMTPEMVTKARQNAAKAGMDNVEFRLGEIEALPVADATVDVIISNCVINLSPEKRNVFQDAYRVLKPGGRLAVSDIVATAELPPDIAEDLCLHAGCVAGAASVETVECLLSEAGFTEIRVQPKQGARELIQQWMPGRGLEDYITSASIQARKPAQ